MSDDAKAAAAKSWFGYGRWNAKYWFIGMEPGGNDGHASYEATNWIRFTKDGTRSSRRT